MKKEHSTLTNNFKTKKTPEGEKFVYSKESSLELKVEMEAIGKTTDTMFDRIYRYYHNDKSRVELTAKEMRIRERWEKAWLLLCRHRTRKQVVDILEKLYGIEKTVAYDDVRNAMMLFTDPADDTKEAKRHIAETMALRGADKCWKKGDMDGYYKFLKEYKDINQLNIPNADNELVKLLKSTRPVQINIVSTVDELKKKAQEIQKTIKVDYEDLTEE